MDGDDTNPWSAESLDDYNFYCCPECDLKSHSQDIFVSHALQTHPKSYSFLPKFVSVSEYLLQDYGLPKSYETLKPKKRRKTKKAVETIKAPQPTENVVEPVVIKEEDPLNIHPQADAEVVIDDCLNDGDDCSPPDAKLQRLDDDCVPEAHKEEEDCVKEEDEEQPTEPEVQCYDCGEMIQLGDARDHFRTKKHGRFNPARFGPPRPHQCPNCKATYKTERNMATHLCNLIGKLPMNKEDGLYHCPKCEKTSKCGSTIKNHFNNVHVKERNFKCSQCDFSAKTAVVLDNHVRQVHNHEKRHYCKICRKGYFHKNDYMHHMTTHGPKGLGEPSSKADGFFPCHVCSQIFTSSIARTHHHRKSHQERDYTTEKCDKCSESISSLWFDQHQDLDHPSQEELQKIADETDGDSDKAEKMSYACNLCLSKFQYKLDFKKHLASTHGKTRLFCDNCNFTTKLKSVLDRHVHFKHSEKGSLIKLTECDLCGVNIQNLYQHLKVCHASFRRCCGIEYCKFILEGLDDFKAHMSGHHDKSMDDIDKHLAEEESKRENGEPTLCPYCGKKIRTPFYLQIHIRLVHEKLRPYACPECDRKFSTEKNRDTHVDAIHRNIKEYLCEFCDFKTARSNALAKHRETKHLKTNTYYCDKCTFKNHNSDTVRTHRKMVHENYKPFLCDICDMAYGYTRELVKHKARVHGNPVKSSAE